MTVLHVAVLLWALALAALVLMVMAHAPVKSVAEIIHDTEGRPKSKSAGSR